MNINSNIKYLRKLKGLTQSDFALKIDVKRSNVASYEKSSLPPVETMEKIADWFNISLDALLRTDLSKSMTSDDAEMNYPSSMEDIGERIKIFMNYLEKDETLLASELNTSIDELTRIIHGRTNPSFGMLIRISDNYGWLSLEWLLRGSGPMIGSTSFQLSNVAEPDLQDYLSNQELTNLEKLLKRIVKRIEYLEKGNN